VFLLGIEEKKNTERGIVFKDGCGGCRLFLFQKKDTSPRQKN